MTPYTIREETTSKGHAVAWLLDEEEQVSICRVVAPSYDSRSPSAALLALARQLTENMARDRMTQLMLDPSRIPPRLADLLRVQLPIEINQAALSTIVWRAAPEGDNVTLTSALRQAIADPPNLEPLRALTGASHVANAIACALAPPVDDDRGKRAVRAVMALDAGAAVEDVRAVVHTAEPRSAEWVDAALRLAEWADGEVSK